MSSVEILSPELVRLALVIGMVLSVYLYEKSHLTTGSIVVPGFLGIHIFEPWVILVCVVNSVISFGIVHRVVPKFFFMTTRGKFHLLIVTSVAIQFGLQSISELRSPVAIAGHAMAGLGCVFPGLIAHDMARNGVRKTALNSLLIASLVGTIVFLCVWFRPQHTLISRPYVEPIRFNIVFLMVLSTVGSVLLKLKTGLRCGYVASAYLVLFAPTPQLLLLILVVAFTTHLLVCGVLIERMIVFGRRKFALMLIVGALFMWSAIHLAHELEVALPYADQSAFAGILILLPGLIANEIQRTNHLNVAIGLGIVGCWTYSLSGLIGEVNSFSRPQYILPFLGMGCLSLFAFLYLMKNVTRSPLIFSPLFNQGVSR